MNRNRSHLKWQENQPVRKGEESMETRKNQRSWGRRVFNRSLRHTSLRSAHFYTGAPPVFVRPPGGEALATHSVGNFARAEVNRKEASSAVRSCAYCGFGPLPAASRCSRPGGAGKSNAAFPALSKGSTALAPRCGYPEVRMNIAACNIHPSHHCARCPRAIHHERGCCK